MKNTLDKINYRTGNAGINVSLEKAIEPSKMKQGDNFKRINKYIFGIPKILKSEGSKK